MWLASVTFRKDMQLQDNSSATSFEFFYEIMLVILPFAAASCWWRFLLAQTLLLQVENEYGYYENAYGEGGKRYASWAAKMAVSQNTGVPWIMCQQYDAPDPVVRTCFHALGWAFLLFPVTCYVLPNKFWCLMSICIYVTESREAFIQLL